MEIVQLRLYINGWLFYRRDKFFFLCLCIFLEVSIRINWQKLKENKVWFNIKKNFIFRVF